MDFAEPTNPPFDGAKDMDAVSEEFDGAKETCLVSKESVTPEEFEDEEDVDYDDIDDRVILTSREEDEFMDSFYMWLKSVDGGLKPPRSSMQHRNVVLNSFHFLDSSGRDYSNLFCWKDLNSYRVSSDFLKLNSGSFRIILPIFCNFSVFFFTFQGPDLK